MTSGVTCLSGLRARLALGSLCTWATLTACSSLLGIEDVHRGPAPGFEAQAGEGGEDTVGMQVGGAGRSNVGGGGGKASNGGSSSGGTVSQDGPSAGQAGETADAGGVGGSGAGGSHAGGMGGSGAGGVGAGDTTVNGHVIDFWGHPIGNVPVQIGSTLVTTDGQGAFTIASVAAQYDVSLVVNFAGDYPRETYGWVYQGLVRRDPTLQVYAGLARRSANILIKPANAVLDASRTLTVALGGSDGAAELTEVGANGVQTSTDWHGPATTQERAHGLLWQFDATSQLPSSYLGYDTALVALSDTSDTATINLNLKASVAIASGNVSGSITPNTATDRSNGVFLRFTSGAAIKLVGDSKGPDKLSYLVPTIANASVTVAAVEGDAFYGQYAVAHKDGLVAGNGTFSAAIPAASRPLTPAAGASNVDAATPFSFAAGAGSAGAFVVSMAATDFYDGLFIVTTKKQFNVPVVASGAYSLVSTHKYIWRVETHGHMATVDAMTGPTGFMDEFSADFESPSGPHTGDGSFTISQSNLFTAK